MKANFKTFVVVDTTSSGREKVCEFLAEIENRLISMTEAKGNLTDRVTVWYREKEDLIVNVEVVE